MQTPTMKTPVSKCIELATYAIRMFGKFPTNVVLTSLAAEMTSAQANLGTTQQDYTVAVEEVLPARVDVKYENLMADRRIRLTQQKAEMADGKKNGRIMGMVFPDGSTPIMRLQGASQIQAMSDLEGRLESAAGLWTEAMSEKADTTKQRESYAAALKYRSDIAQKVRDKRAKRNAAKDAFITKYVEITSRVAAEFPRDGIMQDLFFDEVRAQSALAESDEEGEAEALGGENPGERASG